MRTIAALFGLAALGACTAADMNAALAGFDPVADTRRAFAEAYQDQPFAEGAIDVVADEHGELHTYSLRPCHDGTRICGGSEGVGRLEATPDSDIVTAAYPGRVFVLTPGGGGTLRWRGAEWPLAWN